MHEICTSVLTEMASTFIESSLREVFLGMQEKSQILAFLIGLIGLIMVTLHWQELLRKLKVVSKDLRV